ncbi:MAG: NAD(P)/FAD-dependent oxidoreductase [Phycisphaerales bacterium]|nr:NAD(P)/FAD-dependent oxidoreductase [Phycisphaerales bacterium]
MGGARVVILGGGFSGAYCARGLARRVRSPRDVLLIDRNNYFVFYPLLVEAGTGRLEPRHAVISIRSMIGAASFRLAEVSGVDPSRREVAVRIPELDLEERVGYDHLVLALGSVTRMPDIPGLRRYGWEMKSLADAVAMRDRVARLLEIADSTPDQELRRSMLHLVVIGGNFTGAEVAGEFAAFLEDARGRYRNIGPGEVKVTLIDHSEQILSALGRDLGDFAARSMRRRGIEVLTRESVTEIGPDFVTLASGPRVRAHTAIWCAGIAAPPTLAGMGLPLDERGYLVCEPDLRVRGHPNIWAIGDAAVNPGPDGRAYPATAQHGVREGAHAARNIAAVLAGRPATPCRIKSKGSLAALGRRTGVARVFGVSVEGFLAWWLWRTVYLMKMPGLGRKVRVAMDWTLDFFGRGDPVQLGLHRGPPRAGIPDSITPR